MKIEERFRQSLLVLYERTWGEIHDLREYEWKIGHYFLALAAGLMGLLCTDIVRSALDLKLRTGLTGLVFLQMIFCILYLNRTHAFLLR